MASRMVARSTTAGTPVRSCRITRAGVNWISVDGSAAASHPARAVTCSAVTLRPSSVRSRFSSKTFRLNGRLADPATASSRWIWYSVPPARNVARLPKLFAVIRVRLPGAVLLNAVVHHGYLDIELFSISHARASLSRRQGTGRWRCGCRRVACPARSPDRAGYSGD